MSGFGGAGAFSMVNIILRMILVELYTNMLASKRQQN